MRLWLCLAVLLTPAAASAQLADPPASPTDTDMDVARAAFLEGMRHAERERWSRATEAFGRSYRLSGSPVALFNLGAALRSQGRVREAEEALDRLLQESALDEDMRTRGEEIRAEVREQIARVSIHGLPPGQADVRVDGARRDPSAMRPLDVELDPGAHVVRVAAGASAPFTWRGELEPGARRRVEASVVETVDPDPPATSMDWTPVAVALGALGALVVGAVIAGVVIDAEAQLDPRSPLVIDLP